jgi:toxin YhaV
VNSAGDDQVVVVNGWTVLVHPLFLQEVTALLEKVRRAQRKDPEGYRSKNSAKRLAAVLDLAFDIIPQDPARPDYRLGTTMGREHTHWRRAKFFQQYRLFFRYHEAKKILVIAWVNNEDTKRAYESETDAYAVFADMLAGGNPPTDWDGLERACRDANNRRRQAGAPSLRETVKTLRSPAAAPKG